MFSKIKHKQNHDTEYLNILFPPLLCHRPKSKRVGKQLDVELFLGMMESREAVSSKTDLKSYCSVEGY